MKSSGSSQFTTGDGSILIEVRSKGAPITPEALERARKRAEAVRKELKPDVAESQPGADDHLSPDESE